MHKHVCVYIYLYRYRRKSIIHGGLNPCYRIQCGLSCFTVEQKSDKVAHAAYQAHGFGRLREHGYEAAAGETVWAFTSSEGEIRSSILFPKEPWPRVGVSSQQSRYRP